MRDILTIGEVAARSATLDVGCNICPRRGRLNFARLLAEHGADFGMPALRHVVAHDCPRLHAVSPYDQCGIYFPGLAALYGVG